MLDESGREVVWAERDADSLKLQLMGYLLDKNETSDDAIESSDDYEIRKNNRSK